MSMILRSGLEHYVRSPLYLPAVKLQKKESST